MQKKDESLAHLGSHKRKWFLLVLSLFPLTVLENRPPQYPARAMNTVVTSRGLWNEQVNVWVSWVSVCDRLGWCVGPVTSPKQRIKAQVSRVLEHKPCSLSNNYPPFEKQLLAPDDWVNKVKSLALVELEHLTMGPQVTTQTELPILSLVPSDLPSHKFGQAITTLQGFPGGAVVESLPANAGDTGSSPGLGRSHMPRSN